MELVLKVVDGPNGASWPGLEARFDASGGLIGRAETARLCLPDTTRTVSRFHAHVSFSDGTFFLEEMGSRNAATINGKAVTGGSKAPLRPGDRVRLGRFTLAVELDDPEFPTTEVIERHNTRTPTAADVEDSGAAATAAASLDAPPAAALWDALQDGAGVGLHLAPNRGVEMMRTVGLMLRTLVGGVHRLTTQRVRLREEAGPDKARPQARQIDPVRQAAEESRLLADLLEPAAAGAPMPLAKVQEMLEDLSAQLAAMRTAVKVAVEQTEAKLAPSAVEERLEASLFLDELVPMRRKARLWDLYRRTHGAAASERAEKSEAKTETRPEGKTGARSSVRSGVREAFNRAFSRAYEAEVARLRKDRG